MTAFFKISFLERLSLNMKSKCSTAAIWKFCKIRSSTFTIVHGKLGIKPKLVKTLERLIYNRIFGFIESNNLLSSHQYGFRPGYSCTSQLIHLFHEWAKALDKRLSTDVIFLDFEKAFDSVPHDRLLLKQERFGITGSLLSWLSNFLQGRS